MPRLVRIFIAVIFFFAAYFKAVMPAEGPTLYQHWLVAYPSIRYILPGVEMGLGLWLILGLNPRLASIFTIALIAGFSGLLISEMMKDYPAPCGCMGAAAAAFEPKTVRLGLLMDLGRNLLLMGGAYYIALRSRGIGKSGAAKVVAEEVVPAASGPVV